MNDLHKNKYVGIFVGIIVLFSIIAVLYPEAESAGNSLNDSNMCSEAGCFYNSSRTVECTANNVTAGDTTLCTTGYGAEGFPLSGLFAGGGVLFVIIAAGMLFVVIKKRN